MRVLAITSLFPNPYQPTLATFNSQQFKALAALHPLSVIAPISWTRELAVRWRGKKLLPPDRVREQDGIPIEHPRYIFPPKLFRGYYGHCFRRSMAKAFHRTVAEFQPDVVLAAWAYPDGWAAVKLAHQARLPIALKVHGSDILTLDRGSPKWHRTAEALQDAEAIIAVSQDLAEKVGSFGIAPDKVRIIYNGVDADLFKPGVPEDARNKLGLPQNIPTLLYVGNLFPVKGVDIFVDACGALKRQGVRFSANIVGSGSMRSSLEKQIAALNMSGDVHLIGTKSHRELPEWFRASDVLVLPSYSEGVPNVLLEGIACGTRFVASRVGGIPEIAHLGTGWLVPPGDPDILATGIRSALDAGNTPFAADRPQMRAHADAAREITEALAFAADRYRKKVNAKMVLR